MRRIIYVKWVWYGVVGSEFDKHHHMLLLTIVVEVFRAAYEIPILELKFLFQTELVS